MRRILLYIIIGICPALIHGQDLQPSVPVEGATSVGTVVGLGRASQLDTYLSPLSYSGPQLSFLRETFHLTKRANRRLSFQTILQGAFSHTENATSTAYDWAGRLGFDAGWHYHWCPMPALRLMAGGMVGTDIGFLYNDRNRNNPAQGRLNADVSASVGARYRLRLFRQSFVLRYQACLPLAGAMFSPGYGQSYYEISQGNRDHNVVATWPGNAFSLWQMVNVDIPLRRYTLRLGYLDDIRQSHANHIKVHDISRSFLIGFVRHFRLLKKNEREEGGDLQ
ncbi:MAG: DUF3316 domain-containing protein [Bacteroidaceae bacterium]|nr:DUF3316 domain-containing protein [Bacteroidaceae bacterium]